MKDISEIILSSAMQIRHYQRAYMSDDIKYNLSNDTIYKRFKDRFYFFIDTDEGMLLEETIRTYINESDFI